MGVSKNSGTPKCMVYKKNLFKMDDLVVPFFLETPIYLDNHVACEVSPNYLCCILVLTGSFSFGD